MHQILESIAIALRSIWANKLRSFMTVLGNIVAVTSIVTVVSLIQGMNAMVSNAIVTDVGADAFTIQRLPPVRTAEDEERTRNNPLRHARRGGRHPAVQPEHRVRDGAGAATREGDLPRPGAGKHPDPGRHA